MKLAGAACALGVDGWRLLSSRDPFERLALVALTESAAEAQAERDDGLAQRIANRVIENLAIAMTGTPE